MRNSKKRRRRGATILAAVLTATLNPVARGANTWDGGGVNDNWNTPSNWDTNIVPANDGTQDVTFAGSTRLTPNLNLSFSVDALRFASGAGDFVISSSNNSLLTVGAGGIDNLDTSGVHTVNCNIKLSADQGWNTTLAQTLVGGNIDTNGKTLTLGGSFTQNLSGVISGSGSLIKSAGSTVTLSGTSANTYTGTTTVTSSTLFLNKSINTNAIVGDLIIGDGSGSDVVRLGNSDQIGDNARITINSSATLDLNGFNDALRHITFNGGTLDTGGGNYDVIDDLTYSGSISSAITGGGHMLLFGDTTCDIHDGAAAVDMEIAVPIQDFTTFSGLVKTGGGWLRLSADNTYNRGTSIDAGTLEIGGGGTSGSITGSLFNSASVVFNRSNSLTYSGAISGSGTLTKLGTGALSLGSSNSSYTGATIVSTGTLRLTANNAVPTGSAVTLAANTTFDLNGFNDTIASLSGATGSKVLLGAGSLTVGGNNASTTFSGAIGGGSGSLIKQGTGRLVLDGGNSYTGATTINAGTILLGADNTLPNLSAVTIAAGATLDFAIYKDTIGSLAGAGNVVHLDDNLTAGGNNSSTSFSGILSGSGQFTKSGTGTMTITGGTFAVGSIAVNDTGPLVWRNGASVTVANSVSLTSGGVLRLSNSGNNNTLRVPSVSADLPSSSKLDLGDNSAVFSSMTASDVRTLLISGYHSADWQGAGINSSSAAAVAADGSNTHKTALGYATASSIGITTFKGQPVTGSSVIVNYVYTGDVTLNGKVGLRDFNKVAANFGQSGRDWSQGDVTYDGITNSFDRNAVVTNFSLAQPNSTPETVNLLSGSQVHLVSVAVTAGAVADDPALAGAHTYELRISLSGGEKWFSSAMSVSAGAGSSFYNAAAGGNTPHTPGSWSNPGSRHLAFDTFVSSPAFAVPPLVAGTDSTASTESFSPVFSGSALTASWGDTSASGTGTDVALARFTLLGNHTGGVVGQIFTSATGNDALGFNFAVGPGIWLGGSGNWSDATRWGGAVVPNGATATAQIDLGPSITSNVTLDQNVTISSLAMNADDKLTIPFGRAMVVKSTPVGSWTGSQYTDLTGLIASGRNNSATTDFWDGTGIVTAESSATTVTLHSIAIARASDVRPATATTTALWAGLTITGTDVLVMYTYGGDANLDGKINIDDYIRIDAGFAGGLTGWSNGDFNYDGKVNIDDYTTVIDANFPNQNGFVFPTGGGISASGSSDVSAVPEPIALTCLVMAAPIALCRRRWR